MLVIKNYLDISRDIRNSVLILETSRSFEGILEKVNT